MSGRAHSWSYGSCMFNFVRPCHTLLKSGYTIFINSLILSGHLFYTTMFQIDLLHYLCILKGEEIIGFKRLGSEKMFVTYVLLYFCLWYWAWFYNRQKIVSAFFSCIQHLIFIKIVSVSCEGRLISLAPCSRGEKRYELKEVEGEMSST